MVGQVLEPTGPLGQLRVSFQTAPKMYFGTRLHKPRLPEYRLSIWSGQIESDLESEKIFRFRKLIPFPSGSFVKGIDYSTGIFNAIANPLFSSIYTYASLQKTEDALYFMVISLKINSECFK
jgi:hypothetical protein